MKKSIFIIILMLPIIICGQGIINNGALITVQKDAYISIDGGVNGKYTNLDNGINKGQINLSGTIELQGNWLNNTDPGNYVFTGSSFHDGTVIFRSANAQIIGGTEKTQFENMSVDNANGIVLNASENINGDLILNQGRINTLSNVLTLSDSSHISGGSSSSYVIGTISKKYSQFSDNPFTFPLGTFAGNNTTNEGYSPVTVTFDNSPLSGNLTTTVSPEKSINADQSMSLNRHWTLYSDLNFTGNYKALFSYLSADFVSPFTETAYESDMLWGQWVTSWKYPEISSRNTVGPGGNIEVYGLNTFGEFTGLLCPKPFINNTISDQSECEGSPIVFSVDASDANLYQWTKNAENIPGATYSTFKIQNSSLSDEGVYSCQVSNNCGVTVISPFILVVKQKPIINITPITQIKNIGDSISFTLSPGGSSPFSYQWYKNNNIIDGMTANNFRIITISCADAGNYSCLITNSCGNNFVEAGTLIINNCNGTYALNGVVLYDKKAITSIKNSTVYLETAEGIKLDSTLTDLNGAYKFMSVTNGVYLLDCRTQMQWGGSNPVDALYVNRFYLGTYTFTNSLRTKAANVNNDKNINPLDALLINKRYIGTVTKFTIPDWLFDKPVVTVNDDNLIQDIRAICAGDVDASYPKKYKIFKKK